MLNQINQYSLLLESELQSGPKKWYPF